TVSPAPPGVDASTSVSPMRIPASCAMRSSIATVRGAWCGGTESIPCVATASAAIHGNAKRAAVTRDPEDSAALVPRPHRRVFERGARLLERVRRLFENAHAAPQQHYRQHQLQHARDECADPHVSRRDTPDQRGEKD